MTISGHLAEFRRRLLISAAAVVAGAVAGYLLSDLIWSALQYPVSAAAAAQDRAASINFTNVTSAFDLKIEIAIVAGIVLSSPIWLYQLFAFFVPGMTRKETRYVAGFLGPAIPLFLIGCAVGWVIVPHVVQVMVGFASHDSTTYLGAKDYLEFVLKLILATGVAFVLPVFLVLLNLTGVLSGRGMLRSWRVAILSITLFTAIATPAADVLAMLLLAAPMVTLFFTAVFIALIHDRRAARRMNPVLSGAPGRDELA